MKIVVTLSQLKKILKSETLKFPITFKSEDFTLQELSEFSRLIQTKRRG
jgi:hypothetical protein